jgi:hypothetical protein
MYHLCTYASVLLLLTAACCLQVPINGIMLITSRGDVFSDQKQQQQKQKAAAAQPAVSVAATQ